MTLTPLTIGLLLAAALLKYFFFDREASENMPFVERPFANEKEATQKVNEWAKQLVKDNRSRKPDKKKNGATQQFLKLLAP